MKSILLVVFLLSHGSQLLAATIIQRSEDSNPTSFNAGFNVEKVANIGKQIAGHSWEYGTLSEALLEVYNADDSIYTPVAFPNNAPPKVSPSIVSLAYAGMKFNFSEGTLAPGDGANGDPAALGVSAVLIGETNATVKTAALKEIQHLLAAPRWPNGAISQRDDVAEIWADGVHMMPPYLAYYGAATNNASMVQFAAQQIVLDRDVLLASTTESWKGLWVHIVGPQSQTLGIWCTGNGWASLGMARVLATLKHFPATKDKLPQQKEIVDAMMGIFNGLKGVNRDNTTGLLRNYLIGDVQSQDTRNVTWFGDASGSAALVAGALRLAVLEPSTCKDLYHASRNIRDAVVKSINSNGTAVPTVNPLDWFTLEPYTAGSPEGQAFVLNMYAAWRSCVHHGCCPDPSDEGKAASGPGTWGAASFNSTHTANTTTTTTTSFSSTSMRSSTSSSSTLSKSTTSSSMGSKKSTSSSSTSKISTITKTTSSTSTSISHSTTRQSTTKSSPPTYRAKMAHSTSTATSSMK